MAKHITRWHPDTHPDTVIEYEWDDTEPEDTRVHTPVKMRLRGVDQAPGQVVAAYNRALAENRRKNTAAFDLVTYLASVNVPKSVEELMWDVHPDTGVVTITVSGLTNQQRNNARNQLQAKYGDTVVLVTV